MNTLQKWLSTIKWSIYTTWFHIHEVHRYFFFVFFLVADHMSIPWVDCRKYRALRLDSGNYAWGSENVTKKAIQFGMWWPLKTSTCWDFFQCQMVQRIPPFLLFICVNGYLAHWNLLAALPGCPMCESVKWFSFFGDLLKTPMFFWEVFERVETWDDKQFNANMACIKDFPWHFRDLMSVYPRILEIRQVRILDVVYNATSNELVRNMDQDLEEAVMDSVNMFLSFPGSWKEIFNSNSYKEKGLVKWFVGSKTSSRP